MKLMSTLENSNKRIKVHRIRIVGNMSFLDAYQTFGLTLKFTGNIDSNFHQPIVLNSANKSSADFNVLPS